MTSVLIFLKTSPSGFFLLFIENSRETMSWRRHWDVWLRSGHIYSCFPMRKTALACREYTDYHRPMTRFDLMMHWGQRSGALRGKLKRDLWGKYTETTHWTHVIHTGVFSSFSFITFECICILKDSFSETLNMKLRCIMIWNCQMNISFLAINHPFKGLSNVVSRVLG